MSADERSVIESAQLQMSQGSDETLLEKLYWRAANQPERVAYRFLVDQPVSVANSEFIEWTYYELYQQVKQVADSLVAQLTEDSFEQGPTGQRLLLIYPPGLELIAAFLGCLAVGAVAVPVPPPRRHESLSRWQHILADADVSGILTNQALVKEIEPLIRLSASTEQQASLRWLVTDILYSDAVVADPAIKVREDLSGKRRAKVSHLSVLSGQYLAQQQHARESLAFLQYTSGSTSQPKGVKVTHANLAHNLQQIQRAYGHSEQTRCVIWLPPYHDMGLIGGILQPLYGGYPVTLMSPTSFLRRPVRWLEAISHFGATTSGGPNFAYEYCLQKVSDEDLDSLNLSTWDVAFTGAEPVQAKTISRFYDVFSRCGFRKSAFYPCYGLAEATLFVSGGGLEAEPRVLSLDRQALQHNRVEVVVDRLDKAGEEVTAAAVSSVVSCGWTFSQQHVAIVNPETAALCAEAEIGEIWLTGDSVVAGYWNRPEETQATFAATIADESSPKYLRTGDLGFLHKGDLFITGRLKDLIIIRGRNYYPRDIEDKVQSAHAALGSASAAFSVTDDGIEKLIVVQEVTRGAVRSLRKKTLNPEEIFADIRAALSREFALSVAGIVLLKPGQIPRTTSGKIQRQRCKHQFETDQFEAEQSQQWDVFAQWLALRQNAPGEPDVQTQTQLPRQQKNLPTEEQAVEALLSWLRQSAKHQINSRQMDERRCLSPDVVLALGNKGLLGMQVPEAYGGLALSHRSTLKILQQLGAIDLTLALFVGLNNVLGIRPILRYGSDELKEKWLPRLTTGRELAAFALTESVAGSHPIGIASKAVPTETGWQITGEKIWSGSAAWAGVINVFVQQVDENGNSLGITGFAIERDMPGLVQGPEALTMGMRGMVQNTVLLNQVSVGVGQQLGETGKGMSVAQDAMRYGRLAIAAACVGGMKRCAQLMARYSQRRSISTGKLINNPVLRTRLNWLRHAINTVESLVTLLADRLDADLPVPEELYAACKIMGPELYWQATDNLMQALGGRGYIETNLVPQMMRDARVLRIFEGPTEAIAMHLGARITGQPNSLRAFFASLDVEGGAESTSEMLFEAADWIVDKSLERIEEPRTARYQAHYKIGQMGAWVIALVALKATNAPQMSIEWGQKQLEKQITEALESDPSESAALDETQTFDWIQAYKGSIGEVDSQAAIAELDELLRPQADFSQTTSSHIPAASPHSSVVATQADSEKTTSYQIANTASEKALIQWMVTWLSEKLNVESATVDPRQAFADYGLDSVMAVELAEDLTQHLTLSEPLEATLAWNFPTIAALANHLALAVRPFSNLATASVTDASPVEQLNHLTDDELAAALSAELATVRGGQS